MRSEGGADDVGGVEHLPGLGAIEEAKVIRAESPGTTVVDLGLRCPPLQGGPSRDDGSTLTPSDVPALQLRHAVDLGDGGDHGPLHANGLVTGGRSGECLERGREESGCPSAVASAGTEPRLLSLQDDDPQRGIASREVVGGPQSGESAADDGDVGVDAGGEGRADRPAESVRQLVPPQRQPLQAMCHLDHLVT